MSIRVRGKTAPTALVRTIRAILIHTTTLGWHNSTSRSAQLQFSRTLLSAQPLRLCPLLLCTACRRAHENGSPVPFWHLGLWFLGSRLPFTKLVFLLSLPTSRVGESATRCSSFLEKFLCFCLYFFLLLGLLVGLFHAVLWKD